MEAVQALFKTKAQAGLNKHRDSQSSQDRVIKLSRQQAAQLPAEVSRESQEDELLRCFRSSALRRIPKGTRPTAAAASLKLLRDSYQKNDEESWPSRNKPPDSDTVLRKRVEAKLNEEDIIGAVRTLASEDSIAPRTTETLKALRKKHTVDQRVIDEPMDDDVPAVPPVTARETRSTFFSCPHGSAGGADGLRPQHLKDMTAGLNDGMSTELLEALASLATHMLNGKVPAGMCSFLYGASLTALAKDGGVRPIAVGCTLHRLAGKVVSKRVMTEMSAQL
ncbi:hypothetical protein RvY_03503 [Ramazzottius varieornatus]|uniref:Uncharacterized protein n=1 Tax=Ramazzottius varieornatus TaxID=947166 RepID=A0A1D1UVC8_RAMVA|nr:hypothetical protein RvY_03503 [Ramazzottius varieornatus]